MRFAEGCDEKDFAESIGHFFFHGAMRRHVDTGVRLA
jgi:hypothetical protein